MPHPLLFSGSTRLNHIQRLNHIGIVSFICMWLDADAPADATGALLSPDHHFHIPHLFATVETHSLVLARRQSSAWIRGDVLSRAGSKETRGTGPIIQTIRPILSGWMSINHIGIASDVCRKMPYCPIFECTA